MSTPTRGPLRTGEPPPRPVVSRRRALARRWVAALIVLAVLAGAYVLFFTSVLGVRDVEVYGVHQLTVQQVRRAANVPAGSPLLRLSTDSVRENVAQLPGVRSVEVARSFPSTLEITVVERSPVAVFQASDGLRLIDAAGQSLRTVAKAPRGLPELALPEVSSGDPVARAALTVLTSLPHQLRSFVTKVDARSIGDVRLTFASGRIAKWGDAENNERKAQVLTVLLTRPGKVFDVASPGAPTVR